MLIKGLIENIETFIDDTKVAHESDGVDQELYEQYVVDDLSKSLIGMVTESAPSGATPDEFGQILAYAVALASAQSNIDESILNSNMADYLRQVADVVETVNYQESEAEEDLDEITD